MGIFDIWSSWTDWLGDWWDAFKDKIWDIKQELWGWVDDIAKFWVQQADTFFDILKHTWDDVLDAVEDAKDWATDLSNDVLKQLDAVWMEFGRTVEDLFNNIKPLLEDFVKPINDAINSIQNIKIPSLEDFKSWAKQQLDNILNWDIPFLNQSIKDLWTEADRIWNKIWEIPDDVWKAITQGWDGFVNFLLSEGEKFVEKILDIDIPVDDVINDLERKFKGGGK